MTEDGRRRAASPRPLPVRWLKRLRKWVGRHSPGVCGWRPGAIGRWSSSAPSSSSVLDLIGLTMMVPLIIAATNVQELTKGIVVALGKVLGCRGPAFSPLPILAIIIVGLALKGIVGVLVTRYVAQVVSQGDARHADPPDPGPAGRPLELLPPAARGPPRLRDRTGGRRRGQCFEVLAGLLASMLQVLDVRHHPGPAFLAAADHRHRRQRA